MAPATAARLLVVVFVCVVAGCGKDSPSSPSTPAPRGPSTVSVTPAPSPLIAAHHAADPEFKYRITANLTFQETGGKAARITRLQVTVSGASGWSSSAVHAVDIPVPALGTSAYTLTSVVEIGGPDTTGTWTLDATGTDVDGASLGCRPAQSELRIVDPPGSDAVIVGAGDIAACGAAAPFATAKLLDRIPGIVFTAGDNVHPEGSPTIYSECYGPTWGRHLWRTYPVPGNHDWDSSGAAIAYFGYFGAVSAPPHGYYSYAAGVWHVVALNSNIAANAGSAQYEWLKTDLAASEAACVLAVWHHPLFSSGQNGSSGRMRDAWRLLQDFGAEVVVSGHDHTYERFAPQDADGRATSYGLRQFVVGTGGAGLYALGRRQANSEVFENGTWGVLKLTLKRRTYEWEFVPVDGQTFRDSGSGACSMLAAR
jgi:hypothetical protein